MNALKRALAALLVLLLCCAVWSAAAPSTLVTAVNDSYLSMSAANLPVRIGGEYYVPYGVFGNLGLRLSYNGEMLVLSSGERTLTFLVGQGYVYDQSMTSYSTPAYAMNGQLYVPVKLICARFGFSFSLITAGQAQILRICGSGAALNDSGFVSATRSRLEALLGGQSSSSAAPAPEAPPEEVHKPAQVYLAFFNAPGERTEALLDTLHGANRFGTFFLSPEQLDLASAGTLRRIVGEGHALGLALNAGTVAPAELLEAASAANARLVELTGMTTRIVSPLAGTAALTSEQRTALIAAGYRLWDTTLDSQDNALSGRAAGNAAVTACGKTDDPVVIRFRDREATAAALSVVLDYLRTNAIPSPTITLFRTPINTIHEAR